jgi:hypothetical protein
MSRSGERRGMDAEGDESDSSLPHENWCTAVEMTPRLAVILSEAKDPIRDAKPAANVGSFGLSASG